MSLQKKGAAEAEKANQEFIASLKFKIKELEHEVSTLRNRLEDLRKAKNTTITKREREVVEVGFKRDPKYEARLEELEKMLRDKLAAKNKEIEDLTKNHSEEMEEAVRKQKDLQKQLNELYKKLEFERKDLLDKLEKKGTCSHESELAKQKAMISELEGDKSALIIGNKELTDRVSSFSLELSIKEAKWCEKEEQYKLKLKQQWGDKYQDWMAETERKIQELQDTNTLLRTYLHRSGQRLPETGMQ